MPRWVAVILAIVGLLVGLVVWAYARAVRGGRRRDADLGARCVPVLRMIQQGADPPPTDEIERLAADPATRNLLHVGLGEIDRADLFPARFATAAACAESDLVYWLHHPNELGASPGEIELVATVNRPSPSGRESWTYFVFRYRTHPPHWAARDGWLAGVSGPYLSNGRPAGGGPRGTFSRFEAYDASGVDRQVDHSHQIAVRASA